MNLQEPISVQTYKRKAFRYDQIQTCTCCVRISYLLLKSSHLNLKRNSDYFNIMPSTIALQRAEREAKAKAAAAKKKTTKKEETK